MVILLLFVKSPIFIDPLTILTVLILPIGIVNDGDLGGFLVIAPGIVALKYNGLLIAQSVPSFLLVLIPLNAPLIIILLQTTELLVIFCPTTPNTNDLVLSFAIAFITIGVLFV